MPEEESKFENKPMELTELEPTIVSVEAQQPETQESHTEYTNTTPGPDRHKSAVIESDNETYQKLQLMYNKTRKKIQKHSNVNQLIAEYEGLLKKKRRLERELEKNRISGRTLKTDSRLSAHPMTSRNGFCQPSLGSHAVQGISGLPGQVYSGQALG